jgi:serine phosphatase RsbU (regulator of sigma subunit)
MAAVRSLAPGEAFGWVADQLGDTGDLFLTGVVIDIDATSGRVGYASAGHPPMLLAGVEGVEELPPTGPMLGPFGGTWETRHTELQEGGVLVAYSDGIIEARDGDRHMFGIERLASVVADAQLAGPAAVADACIEAVELFAAGGAHDDITLCVVGR